MTWLGAQPSVAETSTSTGTGDFTLTGAYDSLHSTFASVAGTGDTFPYAIRADDGKKERGTGTLSAGGALQRTNPKRGWNGTAWVTNTLVSFAAGAKVVLMDYPDVEDATHNATAKTTPVDADELPLVDSAASNAIKKLTLANLKTYAAGGAKLLATLTASTSATLVDTTSLTSTYKSYEVRFINLLADTAAKSLNVNLSTDGGSTYDATSTHYTFGRYTQHPSSALAQTSSTTATAFLLNTAEASTSGQGICGTFTIWNPAQASTNKTVSWRIFDTGAFEYFGTGEYSPANVVNAIQFAYSGGNIASGSIEIWGIP